MTGANQWWRITLGRGFDLRSVSNWVVLIAALGLGIATVAFFGFEWSLRATLAVILLWALAREVDPDHPFSAIAVLFISISFFFLLLPSLLLLLFLLLGARYLNLSPGRGTPTVLDMLIILGLGFLSGWFLHWFYLLLTLGLFALALLLGNGSWNIVPLVISFLLLIPLALFSDPTLGAMTRLAWTFMAGSFMLGFILLFMQIHVRAVGDEDQKRLVNVRVMAATLLVMFAAIPTVWLGWGPWAVVATIWVCGLWNLGAAAFGPGDPEEE